MKHTILLLEDNEDRVRAFKEAIISLGSEFKFHIWPDAPTMLKECEALLQEACLISLDHDLNPLNESSPDPGTGMEVAEFLAKRKPVCQSFCIRAITSDDGRCTTSFASEAGRWRLFHLLEKIGFKDPGCRKQGR